MENYKDIFPIAKYYEKIVMPLDKKFRFKGDKMLCPLHNDKNPSMGIVKTKKGEMCHCFGCGVWCDVVDFHIRISRIYKNKILTRKEARRDLCKIFMVSEDSLPDTESLSSVTDDKRREQDIQDKMSEFDVTDFKYKFMEGKLKKKGIGYFNALMLTMIYEMKESEE